MSLPGNPTHSRAIEAYRAGQHGDALRLLESAAAEARRRGDRAAEALALNDLGVVAQNLRRYPEAQRHFEAALALFDAPGDERARAQTLGNLGTLLGEIHRPREAAAKLEQASELFTRLGDNAGASLTLKWLSRTHMQRGSFLEAIFAYERALARMEPLPPHLALLRRFLRIPMTILQRG